MVNRLLRAALAVPLLTFGLGAASVAATGPATPLCAQAAGENHVGIVIEHDTVVKHQCVSFASTTVLALTVLQDSGFEYATQLYNGIGEAVCQIDDVPPQYADCLPSSGSYWVFFVAGANGTWTSSAHGVSMTSLSNGEFVGFRYDPLAGADPPPVAPTGVCPVTTPTPSPTPTPTARPTSSAAPTPNGSPSGTPGPASPTPTGAGATSGPAGDSTSGSSTSTGPASDAAGVLGLSSPGASPDATLGSTTTGKVDGSFSPALAIAIVAIAALMGLLGIQGLRRRRQ